MLKEGQLMSSNDQVKVQPDLRNVGAVWSKKPRFDNNGRLVKCLNFIKEKQKMDEEDCDNKHYHMIESTKLLLIKCFFVRRRERDHHDSLWIYSFV